MKRLEIVIDDYVYEFYQKIAESAGFKIEKVIADSLMNYAGGLSEAMMKNKKPSEKH